MAYFEYNDLNEDLKLMVGSILWEYMIPMMHDPYILEDQILPFFFNLV